MLNKFIDLYNSSLIRLIYETEVIRKKVSAKNIISVGIPLLIVFIELVLVNTFIGENSHLFEGVWGYFITGGFVISVTVFLYFYSKAKENSVGFKSYYKQKIFSAMIRNINPALSFDSEGYMALQDIKNSNLFQFDKWSGEDYVSGMIGETKIEFSEIALWRENVTHTKGKVKTDKKLVFSGIFFKGDFNKNFNSETIIGKDRRDTTVLGKVLSSIFEGKTTVKLEDPDFEKEFDVFSNNEVEARYLLSPSLMERLVRLKREHNLDLTISFYRSKIYIAIPFKRNLFEPSIYQSNLDKNKHKKSFDVLEMMTGIVDDLNLNTRIWSK